MIYDAACRDNIWDCALADANITQLFLAHHHELHTYLVRKLRDTEVALDLTQETFLRFAEHMKKNADSNIENERSYLYRTAHNLAVDHIRTRHKTPTATSANVDMNEMAHDHPSPEQTVQAQGELEHVRKIMDALPPRTRNVFILTRLEGLTYSETAQRLGISDSSVQKHLASAIRHVMAGLKTD